MKREKLQDAIGMVGDDLIAEAANHKKKRKVLRIIPIVAILTCISILVGVVALRPNEEKTSVPSVNEDMLADNAGDDIEENIQESADDVSKNEYYYSLDYCLSKATYPERVLNYSLNADLNDTVAYDRWWEDRNSFRADYDSNTPEPLGRPAAIRINGKGLGWDPTDITDGNPYNSRLPKITGAQDITIDTDTEYSPKTGVKAYDTCGMDITEKLEITGNVVSSRPGKYKVTYSVTDALNRSNKIDIWVTVKNND